MTTVKTQDNDHKVENIVEKVSTSLGIGTNGLFGWTISIPTSFMVAVLVNNKRLKLRWEFLTPRQQYSYYRDIYLPLVVRFHCVKAVGVPELTSAGNMHVHLLCQCDTMVNDYDMWALRKGLLQNTRVLQIARGNARRGKFLNTVHFLSNKSEWMGYLQKDLEKHDYPLFIIS